MSHLVCYWAKTRTDSESNELTGWHPLPYHLLDVAACVCVILERTPRLVRKLSRMVRMSEEDLISWLTFLSANHDIGKFSAGFLKREIRLVPWLEKSCARYQASKGLGHTRFGMVAWEEKIVDRLMEKGVIPNPQGSREQRMFKLQLKTWAWPVMGHHGRPDVATDDPYLWQEQFEETGDHLLDCVDMLQALLMPNPVVLPIGKDFREWAEIRKDIQLASWLINGLITQADWLGSTQEWFPLSCEYTLEAPPRADFEQYWEQALKRANVAADCVSIVPTVPVLGESTVSYLFDFHEPRPLQKCAETTALPQGPNLFIIEDMTGSGKTEAAMVLAHRMIKAEHASSVYLALPTMASSDAMLDRIQPMFKRFMDPSQRPSFVLSHSNADLREELQEIRGNFATNGPDEGSEEEGDNWYQDHRKMALLATFGVGTVDQALMAVLPVYHQSVRLLGLQDSVFIVDEVHAYDEYTSGILAVLLKALAMYGASVILLSATMPRMLREKLSVAFLQGVHGDDVVVNHPVGEGFPRLTHVARSGEINAIDLPPFREKTVQIEYTTDKDVLDGEIALALHRGACVCLFCNTVKVAREEHEAWVARGYEVDLVLSHRMLGERAAIEGGLIRRFGKDSMAAERQGRLIISTPAFALSIDVDKDLIATYLVPIDEIFQRAGRGHRHLRDLFGNKITTGKDGRGDLRVLVFGPDPQGPISSDWYSKVIPGAARIYLDHSRLWRTADFLVKNPTLRFPQDSRRAIEAVYGMPQVSITLPPALVRKAHIAKEVRLGRANEALNRTLNLADGYVREGAWLDDRYPPTRFGHPTVMVRLIAHTVDENGEDVFRPLFPPRTFETRAERRKAWRVSEARLPLWVVDMSAPQPLLEEALKTMPDKGRYSINVILEQEGEEWVGPALRDGCLVWVTQNPRIGVTVE